MSVRYVFALLFGPLIVAVHGTRIQAAVNLGLWVLALLIAPAGFPLVILAPLAHAVLVVHRNGWDHHLAAMVQPVQQQPCMVKVVAPRETFRVGEQEARGNLWRR
jgi:hypothetical protein